MPRFRKKPVEIDAVQFNKIGDHPAVEACFGSGFCVEGRQGYVNVDAGDFIIAELDGSGFYPCKPDVFAATYAPVEDLGGSTKASAGLNIGEAVMALQFGKAVRRAGWNGKGMFIVLMPALHLPPYNTQGTARKVNDRTAKWIGEDAPLDCQPYIAMFTADKKWQPGWVASQADILASDWEIVS